MTPSFIGRIAIMLPGVRPSISFASLPTASTLLVTLLIATIDGSLTTMPRPLAKTSVLAVPKSMARSLENGLNRFLILIKLIRSSLQIRRKGSPGGSNIQQREPDAVLLVLLG